MKTFRKQFLFTICVFLRTVNLLKTNQNKTIDFQAEENLLSSLDLALDLLLHGHSLLRPDTQISKPIFFANEKVIRLLVTMILSEMQKLHNNALRDRLLKIIFSNIYKITID